MFTFTNAILLIGAAQGVILGSMLFWKQSGNRTANRILAAILALLSFSILLHTFSHAGILPFEENHEVMVQLLTVLSAPLIYFYTYALTTYQFRFEKKHLFHLLPFAAALILAIPMLRVSDGRQEESNIQELFDLVTVLIMLWYITSANVALLRHAKIVKENFSTLQSVGLRWLRVFLFSLTIFWLFAGAFDAFFKAETMDIVWIVSCTVFYLVGYFGFMQPEVFSTPIVNPFRIATPEIPKYEKSSLTPEMAEAHYRQLNTSMETEKLYLDKDINLSRLAQHLGIPLHHLSQVINEKTNSNFYDYINAQRIEEAKKLLHEPKLSNRSIASLGFDVGFNSLSAFNAAFKKFTHITPSQFRKQISS